MTSAAGAVYTVEGGTLNFSGRLNPANAVTYTQTGGTVNACTVGNGSSATYSFSIPSGTFTMSGGTINLVQINSTATATNRRDYQVVATPNITGGTSMLVPLQLPVIRATLILESSATSRTSS